MMHLIAAIFSFVFSFGHAQQVAKVEAAPITQTADFAGPITEPVPSYGEMRSGKLRSGYAEASCACGTKSDVTFIMH
jgi:hypothetical protein